MKKEDKNPSFEEALKDLEKIVAELEKGEGSLESQFKSFEKGISLSRDCMKRLEEVEKKVELLTRDSKNQLVSAPFTEKP